MPDRLKLAMQILGKDKLIQILKEVHEREIQPFIENRREILKKDPARVTFDASRNARVFESMEHAMELMEGIAKGENGEVQRMAYLRLVKRLVPLSFGTELKVEPLGVTPEHQLLMERIERDFLGRKAVESRKRRYHPYR
ncbi:hypothetical protein [Thermococcus sp.]